jgi:hypothetical protein
MVENVPDEVSTTVVKTAPQYGQTTRDSTSRSILEDNHKASAKHGLFLGRYETTLCPSGAPLEKAGACPVCPPVRRK